MTGSVEDIDLSLANIWESWYKFRKGKRNTQSINEFEYYLESNITRLHHDLTNHSYAHAPYTYFNLHDSKPRKISVASVRDRVVHRMLYDYLVPIWDKTFIYDAWSCRPGKGLHKAIDRADYFMRTYPQAWVWRADIRKMFHSIDHDLMKQMLRRRVQGEDALWLLDDVIDSYPRLGNRQETKDLNVGLPIGNLTSQVMSNVFLNEFDRFMMHRVKPLGYLRYGDDWLCFMSNQSAALQARQHGLSQIEALKLTINSKVDRVCSVWKGVDFIGVRFWPSGYTLQPSVRNRAASRLTDRNASSYRSLIAAHEHSDRLRAFDWLLIDT